MGEKKDNTHVHVVWLKIPPTRIAINKLHRCSAIINARISISLPVSMVFLLSYFFSRDYSTKSIFLQDTYPSRAATGCRSFLPHHPCATLYFLSFGYYFGDRSNNFRRNHGCFYNIVIDTELFRTFAFDIIALVGQRNTHGIRSQLFVAQCLKE